LKLSGVLAIPFFFFCFFFSRAKAQGVDGLYVFSPVFLIFLLVMGAGSRDAVGQGRNESGRFG
jgi:hypothetical protein